MSESDRHRNGLTIDQDAQTPQQSEPPISSQSKLRGVPTYPNSPSGEAALKTIETMTTETKTMGKTRNGSPQGRTQQPKSKKAKKPTKHMKAKNSNPKVDDARHRIGKKKKDGTALTVPSAEGHPGDQTELISVNNDSTTIEKVTPQKGENFDELGPSTPSPPPQRTFFGGFTDLALAQAAYREFEMKQWEQRLENKIHFEKWESLYEGEYDLLFFRGVVFVLDDESARAPLFADRLGPDSPHLVTEIIDQLDIRDFIAVPGPEIPADFIGAVHGRYFPLELLRSLLWCFNLPDDETKFSNLHNELEDRKAWHQEERLRESRLRKACLEKINMNELWYRMSLLDEERNRMSLLKKDELEEKLRELLRKKAKELSERQKS
jgi:hypothetical protein